ncbi:DNA recombination protein RmuC [Kosmotoga pacifica]|uniref:DNA recombination protein RmuC n=1 Tax=Kosmotoga pacifica TaxID=1330330 RepID=UPI000AEFF86F|nr:DNA recombination protein RmuC [Kosmotoga pacifica]
MLSWIVVLISLVTVFILSISAARLYRELKKTIAEKSKLELLREENEKLNGNIEVLRSENEQLKIENARFEEQLKSLDEKLNWLETAKAELEKNFKALASDVTAKNTEDFLNQANDKLKGLIENQKTELEKLLDPLKNNLDTLQKNIVEIENKREKAYGGLEKQLQELSRVHNELQTGLTKLNSSLKSSTSRGRWGEYQLRRIVELAGMTAHIDFEEQQTNESGRPDMIIKLPKGGEIPVDAKTPLNAYLEAMETQDENLRVEKLKKHVKSVKDTIKSLSARAYWEQFKQSPDFVIMFIPMEAAVSTAFEMDPSLLEEAINKKVLITTPITLLALLKSVAYGWQQFQLTENAMRIAEEGKELYKRLSKFLGEVENVGKKMKSLVQAYNTAVGSLEGRLLPKARSFKEISGIEESEPNIQPLELEPRPLNAPELGDED